MNEQEIRQQIKELQEKLKELKSPKHGDIVLHHGMGMRIIIKQEGQFVAYDEYGNPQLKGNRLSESYNDGFYKYVSNVFDD